MALGCLADELVLVEVFNRPQGQFVLKTFEILDMFMGLLSLLTSKYGRNLFLPAHGRGAALPKEIKTLLRQRAGLWDLPELPDLGVAS